MDHHTKNLVVGVLYRIGYDDITLTGDKIYQFCIKALIWLYGCLFCTVGLYKYEKKLFTNELFISCIVAGYVLVFMFIYDRLCSYKLCEKDYDEAIILVKKNLEHFSEISNGVYFLYQNPQTKHGLTFNANYVHKTMAF